MNVSRRRATLATFGGSSFNTLIISIQAIVLMPLYLQIIGPRLYGAWLGSGDILVWMQAFDLGLPNLMIQRIGAAQGKGDLQTVGEYFATGMVALICISLCILGIAMLLSPFIPSWMGLAGEEAQVLQQCFRVAAVGAAVNIANNSVVGFSRGVQRTAFINLMGVVSSLIGFGVSLGLVFSGAGLWAVALGLLSRSIILVIGSFVFTFVILRTELHGVFCLRRTILREFFLISPATALGGLSYTAMNQSETALAAILIRPEAAVILSLTRKAVDMARSLVDMIGVATYGSFAHLVASDQRDRAQQVYAQINSLRLSLAVALAAAYLAVNASLISVWVGFDQYGGPLLTGLIAIQFVLVGGSYLINYLYRATGPIMKGSFMLVAESIVRVPLTVILLRQFGLWGAAVSSIVTSTLTALIVYRWTHRALIRFSKPVERVVAPVWIARLLLLAAGFWIGITFHQPSWSYVLIVGSLIALTGGIGLIYMDPLLWDMQDIILSILKRLQCILRLGRGPWVK